MSAGSDMFSELLIALFFFLGFEVLHSDWLRDRSDTGSVVTKLRRFKRKSLMDGLGVPSVSRCDQSVLR